MIIYEKSHIQPVDTTPIRWNTTPPMEYSPWYPIQKWGFGALEISGCNEPVLPFIWHPSEDESINYLNIAEANLITANKCNIHKPVIALYPDEEFDSAVGGGVSLFDSESFKPDLKVPYKGKIMRNLEHLHVYGKSTPNDLYDGWLGIGMCFITTNQWSYLMAYKVTELRNCDLYHDTIGFDLVFLKTKHDQFYIEREALDFILTNELPKCKGRV